MCGPAVAWDWLVLDVAYVLALVGGSMVLRAKVVSLPLWIAFGLLGTAVGGALFGATYASQAAQSATAFTEDAVAMLAAC